MHELLHDDGFRVALVVALACSVLVFVANRRSRFSRLGFQAGAAASLAILVALFATDRQHMLSIVGLAALAFGVIVVRHLPARWSLVAAIPGAGVIAIMLRAPVPNWASVVCFVAIIVVIPCAISLDSSAPRILPLLLSATALGMWGTTPDTEHTRVLAGALLGLVLLAFDTRLRRGTGGTAVLIGLMVWAAVVDGYPRRGAVVGALACFGVIVLLPLLHRIRTPLTMAAAVATIVVQAGVVAVASRVAGLRDDVLPALAISAVALAVAAGVLSVLVRVRSRDRAD